MKTTKLFFSSLIALLFIHFNSAIADNLETTFHDSRVIIGPSGSIFGMYTKNIGDFNGDGFEDFAISSRYEDNYNGAVRIYFGGENADLNPDLIIRGKNQESFGTNFANAGDFNGDGFDDLMISTGSYPPKVNLYYGGPNYDTNEDVSYTDNYVSSYFGASLTKLGDINGDGFGDVAIGNSGVNIYFGRSIEAYNIMPDFVIINNGSLTTHCGDINGDGFDDVVIASGGNGIVHFFAGSEHFDIDQDAYIQGGTSYGFGNSIYGGKDINNDGLVDIVIGETARTVDGLTNVGAVYVLFGKTNLFEDTNPFGLSSDFYMFGTKEGERFGTSVSIVQDMNGDGFDEIAVGEDFNFFSGEKNKVLIYNGGNQISNIPSNVFNSREEGSLGHFAVASIDLNQDGYGEVLAADYSNDKVYYFDNSQNNATLFNEVDIELSQQYASDISGDFNGDEYNDLLTYEEGLFINQNGSFNSEPNNTVSDNFAGDINGDGKDEIINRSEFNVIDIIWGNKDQDFSSEMLYQVPDSLTLKFVTYGDFNGDGLSDIVLKSYTNVGLSEEQQKFLIFYGGAHLSSEPNFIEGNDNYVVENCQVGDFNGDSFDDILLQVRDDNTNSLFIQYGSSIGLENNSYVNLSDFENYRIGAIYKSCDLNGDGFDELTLNNLDNQKQYIIFGQNETKYNEANLVEFNHLYKNADVNNDGITDAIIDQKVIYGGENFPNSGYINIPMSFAMISAGDINNDGLDDLLMEQFFSSDQIRFGIVLNSKQNKAPRIVSVKDVPADQGGKVSLTWFKSSMDGGNVNNYQIERSIAPIGSGFAWEVINTIPASHFIYYAYTAPTLNDETPENTGNTYFRITALTDNDDVYYRSNILYGNSIDNLAPAQVQCLKASPVTGGIKLSWQLNTEEDFKEYLLYRSAEEITDFSQYEALASTTDSVFIDFLPSSSETRYTLVGSDIHHNLGKSASVIVLSTAISDLNAVPTELRIENVYPNPANDYSQIEYGIPEATAVDIHLLDLNGRQIQTVLDAFQQAGNYQLKLNTVDIPAGFYYVELKTADKKIFVKLLINH